MPLLFALVDANNFYVSCERVFDPFLERKPLVVLSNNDGCAISRSEEAKKIGVKMWMPYFKIVTEFGEKIIAKSSNYALYGEMSRRFHLLLSFYASHQEIYSIDESFLDFSAHPRPEHAASQIYARCLRDLWLPVCVGTWSTKTRAKFANMLAKKESEYCGRCHLENIQKSKLEHIFRHYSVWEVWWIGKNHREHLEKLQIRTIYDLYRADPLYIRNEFSIVMEKTVRELQWESCLELEEVENDRKMIMTSRSFGHMITKKADLSEALISFVTLWAEKLRMQGSQASSITISIQSNKYRQDLPQYTVSTTLIFLDPTDDTGVFIQWVQEWLEKIYHEGIYYKKAGVLIHQIEPKNGQLSLRMEVQNDKRKSLMKTLDRMNQLYGRSKIFFAWQGIAQNWKLLSEKRSPSYLHKWEDVPKVS